MGIPILELKAHSPALEHAIGELHWALMMDQICFGTYSLGTPIWGLGIHSPAMVAQLGEVGPQWAIPMFKLVVNWDKLQQARRAWKRYIEHPSS